MGGLYWMLKSGMPPIAGWFMMENPEEKVDDLGGDPHDWNPMYGQQWETSSL